MRFCNCRNFFIMFFYVVELNQSREAHPNIRRSPHPSSLTIPRNFLNRDSTENRSANDSNDDDLSSSSARGRDRETNMVNDLRDESYERLNSMFARARERVRRINSHSERRINLCYRRLDRYVTLVRRYFNVSRNRDTVSYM